MSSRPGPSLLLVVVLAGCDQPDLRLDRSDPATRAHQARHGGCHDDEPLPDLTDLLAAVPDGTTWDQLDPAVQDALEDHAEALFEPNRDAWSHHALLDKEAIVLADAGAIRDNVDVYLHEQFAGHVDPALSVDDLSSADLADALKRLYLAYLGTARSAASGVVSLDWDGVTPLDQFPLPDARTLEDLNDYADDVADALEDLLDSGALSADEAALATEASYVARSLRTGSFGFTGYGGDDLLVPGSLANWGTQPVYDYVFFGMIPTAEEYLRLQNAVWMGEARYVSAPNVAVATDFVGPAAATNPAFYDALLGAEPEVARGAELLAQWWTDRLLAEPDAGLTCRAYGEDELERLLDAFLADMKLPYDPGWLASFDARLDQDAAALAVEYQDAAIATLARFDDTDLPPDQRAAVVDAILAETRIGSMVATTQAALTAATGSDVLAAEHASAIAAVPVIGGTPTVDPAHEAVVDRVWANVRSSLVARHSSGTRAFPLNDYLPLEVLVDNRRSFRTAGGNIYIGLGAPTTEALLYVVLTHEALHALDQRAGLNPTGAAIEGAATLTAHPLAREILAEHVPADQAPFFNLVTASGDARRYGISDATVAVLTTDCPPGQDSTVLAADVAAAWGAPGSTLTEAPLRAHWGTQFLSYVGGQVAYQELVEALEAQVRPGIDDRIDPFDLHSCGLVSPPPTPEVAAALAACLGL